MREIIQDTIQADSVIVDTLKSVVELPPRDSNLVEDMSHIFGSVASKADSALEITSRTGGDLIALPYAIILPVVICLYILIFRFYGREIGSIAKIIFYPSLFDAAHEVNSVHRKQYLTYAFIFSVLVITLLSWLYFAEGDVRVPIAVYFYFVFKAGLPRLIAFRSGRNSAVAKQTFFIVSFYATSFMILTPIAVLSIVFGIKELLYTLILIVLWSFYVFLARFFYKEKFSFKQFLLYLCTAEVIPLALISSLFYTKIITFGN